MKDLLILLAHLFTTVAKLLGPGGAFEIDIDKDLVRRVLAAHYRPGPSGKTGHHG